MSGPAANCEGYRTERLIILVTDGDPDDARLVCLAAQGLKANGSARIMGILVMPKDDVKLKGASDSLYALTSCCRSESMSVPDPRKLKCAEAQNASCPYMSTANDFAALVDSTHRIVQEISGAMECNAVVSEVHLRGDRRSLWCLLLLLPLVAQLLWARVLQCLSNCGSTELPAQDMELSSAVERPSLLLAAPVEAALEAPEQAMCSATPDSLHAVEAAEKPKESTRASKKWKPVHTAYIIGGQRLNVDFGSQLPPSAPGAARRGLEEVTSNDLPEDFVAACQAASDEQQAVEEEERDVTAGNFAMLIIRGPSARIAPALRRYDCGVLVPLIITLLLIPVVVIQSGLLTIIFHGNAVPEEPGSTVKAILQIASNVPQQFLGIR